MILQDPEAEATMTTYQNGVKIMDLVGNPLVEIHSTERRASSPSVIGTMIVPLLGLERVPTDMVLRMYDDMQMMLRWMMVGRELVVEEVETGSRLVEAEVGLGTMITSNPPQRRRPMGIRTGNTSSRLAQRRKGISVSGGTLRQ